MPISNLAPYNPFLGPGPMNFLLAHPPDPAQPPTWPGVRNLPPAITAAMAPQDQASARLADFVAQAEAKPDTGIVGKGGPGAGGTPGVDVASAPGPTGPFSGGITTPFGTVGSNVPGAHSGLGLMGGTTSSGALGQGVNAAVNAATGRSYSLPGTVANSLLSLLGGPFAGPANSFLGSLISTGRNAAQANAMNQAAFNLGFNPKDNTDPFFDVTNPRDIPEANAPPTEGNPTEGSGAPSSGSSSVGVGAAPGTPGGIGAAVAGPDVGTAAAPSGGEGDGDGDGGEKRGGLITRGNPRSKKDDVPTRLQYGEFVIPRGAVRYLHQTAPALLAHVARVSGQFAGPTKVGQRYAGGGLVQVARVSGRYSR